VKTRTIRLLALILAFGALWSASAQTASHLAVPYPTAETPKAIDIGPMSAVEGNAPISITIALHLRNVDDAENLLKAVSTPGSAQYHQFLTSQQFAARFAPLDSDVAKVIAGLAKYGLTAQRETVTTLKVTGTPANIERAFAVSLHTYQVAAHGKVQSYTYRAPVGRATIPTEIAGGLISAVAGLDSRPTMRPHNLKSPKTLTRKVSKTSANGSNGNTSGELTVTDFANLYDVNPLYKAGVTGANRVLGIMTFAAFTPSDAFKYWNALGLSVKSSRLRIVNVDGGPGKPSDASGSDETTLDVEQSGGIAPGANIILYQAPNTNQAFVDIFAAAIDANVVDSLSISWGEWEWFDNLANAPVTDPVTGATVATTVATHELLVRAGIQGQSVFTAAGDSGAYDVDRDEGFCYPATCSDPLTVDYPASDPAITASGGTTLPGIQSFCLNNACTPPYYNVNVVYERVWGWDYLNRLCAKLGYSDPVSCGTFPGGGGGGVSVFFDEPDYQFALHGAQRSQPGQSWTFDGQLLFNLPANFAGRNVPDLSFNADPDTGYEIYYTSSVSGFGIDTFWGGTSFVAPQLNGVTALLGQSTKERLGLLNPLVYSLALTDQAYTGANPPLHAIKYGDNWFYFGHSGYNQGAGLGTLDVANFANMFHP
jgi:kumamolisin